MSGTLTKVEIITSAGEKTKVSPEIAAIIGLVKGKAKNTLVFTYDSDKYAKSRLSTLKKSLTTHLIADKVEITVEGSKITVKKM